MSSESAAGAVELADGVWVRASDLRFSFARSRGPGGQAVNKVATKAQLRVRLEDLQGLEDRARARLRRLAGARLVREGVLIISADTHRTQGANRRACLERLRALVGRALISPRPRRPTRPPRAAVEGRLGQKRKRADRKAGRRKPGEEP